MPTPETFDQRDIFNQAKRLGCDRFFLDMQQNTLKGVEGDNIKRFKTMRQNEQVGVLLAFERDGKITLANNRDKLGAYYNALICAYTCEALRELQFGKKTGHRFKFTEVAENYFSELINDTRNYEDLLIKLRSLAKG